MQGTDLMVKGAMELGSPRLRLLLQQITPPKDFSAAAAALLDAFQWRVQP